VVIQHEPEPEERQQDHRRVSPQVSGNIRHKVQTCTHGWYEPTTQNVFEIHAV
jgi:hypothetical protein